jgi:hypothetical protein
MAMHLSRHAIFHRQRHACYLCAQAFAHRALEFHGGHPDAPSRDHVFPRGRGGLAEANILLAHKRCNQRKGDRWPHPCEVIYLAAIYAAPAHSDAFIRGLMGPFGSGKSSACVTEIATRAKQQAPGPTACAARAGAWCATPSASSGHRRSEDHLPVAAAGLFRPLHREQPHLHDQGLPGLRVRDPVHGARQARTTSRTCSRSSSPAPGSTRPARSRGA